MNEFQNSRNARILSCYKIENESELQKSEITDLEKSGRAAFIGEKRTFGGREYIKTANGWKFHGKGTGSKAQAHVAASVTTPRIPTFSEKYPGNTPSHTLSDNCFAINHGTSPELLTNRSKYRITNVTDKNIMYERLAGGYSSRSERMSIKDFTERLDRNGIFFSKLPKLEEAFSKVATSESEAYKTMIMDLKNQTTDLKNAYIIKTKVYREGEFDKLVSKYGNYTYENWKAEFPTPTGFRGGVTLSREGNSLREKVSKMKYEGKEKYVKGYMKLAEMHYNSSLEKLGLKITEAGFDTTKVKLSSSSVGVNFSTEVTDGNKYMRAYTIIAEGPINAPHYRYLFTSNKNR